MSFFSSVRKLLAPSGNNIILPKEAGTGIQIDQASPRFGYRDIIGLVLPNTANPTTSPAIAEFQTGIYAYQYDSNDRLNCVYHIPHDYVPDSDTFIHLHWGHNGVALSGNLSVNAVCSYASRVTVDPGVTPAAVFSTPVTIPISITAPPIGDYPQHCHVVTEVPLSAQAGAGGILNSNNIEVDGVVLITFTYTGTLSPNPFIFTGDIHYQSNNAATRNKDPNFYT